MCFNGVYGEETDSDRRKKNFLGQKFSKKNGVIMGPKKFFGVIMGSEKPPYCQFIVFFGVFWVFPAFMTLFGHL